MRWTQQYLNDHWKEILGWDVLHFKKSLDLRSEELGLPHSTLSWVLIHDKKTAVQEAIDWWNSPVSQFGRRLMRSVQRKNTQKFRQIQVNTIPDSPRDD